MHLEVGSRVTARPAYPLRPEGTREEHAWCDATVLCVHVPGPEAGGRAEPQGAPVHTRPTYDLRYADGMFEARVPRDRIRAGGVPRPPMSTSTLVHVRTHAVGGLRWSQ